MKKWLTIALAGSLLFAGCASYQKVVVSTQEIQDARTVYDTTANVVLHLKGGRFVETKMNLVKVDGDTVIVVSGNLYTLLNPEGQKIDSTVYPKNDVLFMEVRSTKLPPSVGLAYALTTVMVVTDLSITAACIMDPKACWGSCPTFYNSDGYLVAEGFSFSLFKTFETWDLDRIDARAEDGTVPLTMRNEALETHLVHDVVLVAVPKGDGEIFFDRNSGKFIRADRLQPPIACENCSLELVSQADDEVYVSPADSIDLARRDTITLIFPNPGGERIAIDIRARNSLLGTHILYGLIGLTGPKYWTFVHMMDEPLLSKPFVINGFSKWEKFWHLRVLVNGTVAGKIRYEGPIAFEHFTLTLDNPGTDSIVVQLEEVKGDWEFDNVVAGRVVDMDVPYREIAAQLPRNAGDYFRTYPGDSLILTFDVGDGDYQFFLKTRGYYYEWQRTAWAEHPDPKLASYLFFHPDSAYRYFAKSYKAGEVEARNVFIKSRVHSRLFALNRR